MITEQVSASLENSDRELNGYELIDVVELQGVNPESYSTQMHVMDDGHITVLFEFDHNIGKFSPSGEIVFKAGGKGPEDGNFLYPSGFSHTPDHRLTICDSWNNRIQVLDKTGTWISSIKTDTDLPTRICAPSGVAVTNDEIAILDSRRKCIEFISSEGTHLRTCSLDDYFPLSYPKHIEFSNGGITISDSNGLLVRLAAATGEKKGDLLLLSAAFNIPLHNMRSFVRFFYERLLINNRIFTLCMPSANRKGYVAAADIHQRIVRIFTAQGLPVLSVPFHEGAPCGAVFISDDLLYASYGNLIRVYRAPACSLGIEQFYQEFFRDSDDVDLYNLYACSHYVESGDAEKAARYCGKALENRLDLASAGLLCTLADKHSILPDIDSETIGKAIKLLEETHGKIFATMYRYQENRALLEHEVERSMRDIAGSITRIAGIASGDNYRLIGKDERCRIDFKYDPLSLNIINRGTGNGREDEIDTCAPPPVRLRLKRIISENDVQWPAVPLTVAECAGTIYINDMTRKCIHMYSKDFEYSGQIFNGIGKNRVFSLDGMLYVSDYNNNRLLLVNPENDWAVVNERMIKTPNQMTYNPTMDAIFVNSTEGRHIKAFSKDLGEDYLSFKYDFFAIEIETSGDYIYLTEFNGEPAFAKGGSMGGLHRYSIADRQHVFYAFPYRSVKRFREFLLLGTRSNIILIADKNLNPLCYFDISLFRKSLMHEIERVSVRDFCHNRCLDELFVLSDEVWNGILALQIDDDIGEKI